VPKGCEFGGMTLVFLIKIDDFDADRTFGRIIAFRIHFFFTVKCAMQKKHTKCDLFSKA
jgi:hypothetical protein